MSLTKNPEGESLRRSAPRFLALLVMLALLAVACGNDDADDTSSNSGTEQGSGNTGGEDVPADGLDSEATLRVGYLFVAASLDPHQVLHIGHWPSTSPFWDRLFDIDGGHQVNPGLAEQWSFDDAGTTLTITMREGVNFHDGTPVDAEAARVSLDRARSDEAIASVRNSLSLIESVAAVDERTLEITLAEPNGDILVALGGMAGSVINPAYVDGDFAPPPIEATSGPFAVNEFRPDEVVVYERISDDHWNEVAARVRVLEVHAYPDSTAGLNALETGMLDVAFGRGIPYDVIDETLARADGYERIGHRANGYRAGLHLRNTLGQFDDVRVRQAIAHAIDRQVIADVVLGDGCAVIHGFYPPGVDGYVEGYEPFPFDPDRAVELLEEAGATGLSFDSLIPAEGQAERLAGEAIQAMLKDVGLDMQLVPAALAEVPIRFSEGNEAAAIYAGVNTNPTALATQFLGPNGVAGPEADQLRDVIEAALIPGDDRAERIAEAGKAAAESALIIPICAPESPWVAHESVAFVDEMPFTVWGVAMLQNLGVRR